MLFRSIANQLAPGARDWWTAAHRSTEPAHTIALKHLDLTPILELNMRLGEGTGAATALPLLLAATKILTNMATFTTAGISGPTGEATNTETTTNTTGID